MSDAGAVRFDARDSKAAVLDLVTLTEAGVADPESGTVQSAGIGGMGIEARLTGVSDGSAGEDQVPVADRTGGLGPQLELGAIDSRRIKARYRPQTAVLRGVIALGAADRISGRAADREVELGIVAHGRRQQISPWAVEDLDVEHRVDRRRDLEDCFAGGEVLERVVLPEPVADDSHPVTEAASRAGSDLPGKETLLELDDLIGVRALGSTPGRRPAEIHPLETDGLFDVHVHPRARSAPTVARRKALDRPQCRFPRSDSPFGYRGG